MLHLGLILQKDVFPQEIKKINLYLRLNGEIDMMTDDVVFMTPGNEPFGKEAVVTTAEKMKDVLQVLEGTSEIREIQVLGDWAFHPKKKSMSN